MRSTEGGAKILGLQQSRCRVEAPDGLHGHHGCTALIEQDTDKSAGVSAVRIPKPKKATKTSGSEGFVNGGISVNPRVTLGETLSKVCQPACQIWRTEMGVSRSAAV